MNNDLKIITRELVEALEGAQEDTCSTLCPSEWRTGHRPPHSEKCQNITNLLAKARAALEERAADPA
jgi:hypothetical protein